MLGICKTQNISFLYKQMKYGNIIARYHVRKFVDELSKDAFKTLIYSFLKIRWNLHHPNTTDYEKALDTFRQKHYHEFLYHHKQPNATSLDFIHAMQAFHDTEKKTKKKYVELFTKLESFSEYVGEWPGGHYKGTPFVFTEQKACMWFYDQVLAAKKKYNIFRNKNASLFYPILCANDWTGHTDCPANRILPPHWSGDYFDKINKNWASYLIHVGYESIESVKETWNLDCTNVQQMSYALFVPDVTSIVPVFQELNEKHTETLEDCLRLHLESSEALRSRVFSNIVRKYDEKVQQLAEERDDLKRKFNSINEHVAHTEMQLRTTKRKLDDVYDDCNHFHGNLMRAKREIDDLVHILRQRDDALRQRDDALRQRDDILRQKDDELRKSIHAQWQLYYRLYPAAAPNNM